MNVQEYQKYMSNRRDIISTNKSNRMKGLPQLTVPEKLEAPKVRIAYSKNDNSYMGRLKEDEECPEDCYIKLEPALY
jgi:hypothetical protein